MCFLQNGPADPSRSVLPGPRWQPTTTRRADHCWETILARWTGNQLVGRQNACESLWRKEKVRWHLIGLLKNFELEGGGWVIDILHDMHAAEPGSLLRSEKVLHTEQSQCMARRYVAKQRGSHTGRPC